MKRIVKRTKKASTIRFRPSLFWDVDPKTIDLNKHTRYIIERILDFGNDREVRWMWQRYPRTRIHSVVARSRGLRARTKPLWLALTKQHGAQTASRAQRSVR